MWSAWKNPANDEWVRSCAILTTAATGIIAGIHNRMPVALVPEVWEAWLDRDVTEPEEVKSLIRPIARRSVDAARSLEQGQQRQEQRARPARTTRPDQVALDPAFAHQTRPMGRVRSARTGGERRHYRFPLMARLVLVRHAPTAETGKTLYGRLPGHPLSEKGLQMAAEVADRLASVKVAAIYASPLERAMQTAEAIADHATQAGPDPRRTARSRLRKMGGSQPAIALQAQGLANGRDHSIAGQIPRR